MQWFKFYGQDFFSDPKIMALTVEEKLCFIALLSMANAEDKCGLISNVNPASVLGLIAADPESPMWKEALNFIEKFEALHLITNVTFSDVTNCYTVTVTKFKDRNERVTQEAIRQRRFREKKHINNPIPLRDKAVTKPLPDCDGNVTVTQNKLDKTRLEKKIGVIPLYKNKEGGLLRGDWKEKKDEFMKNHLVSNL